MFHLKFHNRRDMKALIKFIPVFVLFFTHCCVADNQYSVIIVGAGSSGIAAATKLLENNFTDFIILEAENRIGGRIFTVPFGDGLVDLGAQWCHGQKNNIVYEITKDMGLLTVDDVDLDTHLYTKYPIDRNISNTLNTLFDSIYQNVLDPNATSLYEYFIKRYNDSINELYSGKPEILQYARDLANLYLGAMCSMEGSFDVSDISPQSEYQICEGEQFLHWNGKGYKIFLDILMKKYPNPDEGLPIDDKILLNKEVTNINWKNDLQQNSSRVQVKCSDGEVYYANQVILTVSLGVLKENVNTMFTPKLPNQKLNAIEDIGFGAVMKLYVSYEDKWWPENLGSLGFVWSEEERERLKNDNLGWYLNISSLITIKGNENVLCFWIAGRDVPKIENLTDDKVLGAIKYISDLFLKPKYKNVAEPSMILRTKWGSYPHFRGTYSYDSVKMRENKRSRDDLAEPLNHPVTNKPILLFAGEATNRIHYSTVQGAIETGFCEATRILEMYK